MSSRDAPFSFPVFSSDVKEKRPRPFVWLGIFVTLFILFLTFSLLFNPLYRKHVDIEMHASRSSCIKMYWAGNGKPFSERKSILIDTEEGRKTYRLRIDSREEIKRLRIDPTMKEDIVGISRLVIHQPGYENLLIEGKQLLRLEGLHHIKNIELVADDLWVQTSGKDPQLFLRIDPIQKTGFKKSWDTLSKVLTLIVFSLFSSSVLLGLLALIIHIFYNPVSGDTARYPTEERSLEGHRLSGVTKLVLATIFLILFIRFVIQLSSAYSTVNTFGSTHSPYSDALMWLRGSIHFLDDLPFKTYRPTINLFFSSLYSLRETLTVIPLFGIIFFLINCLFLFSLSTISTSVYACLLLLFFSVFFTESIEPLNVGQLMVDFLPFSMTLFGTIMVGTGLNMKRKSVPIIMIGLLLLGIAAAVRGIPLLGGTIIALLVSVLLWLASQKSGALMAPGVFLSPLFVDVVLQKYYGALNNGIFSFFGFYHDRYHSYYPAGKELLMSMKIPDSEILLTYFRYLFTPEGFMVAWRFAVEINSNTLLLLTTESYLVVFAGTGIFTFFLNFLGARSYETVSVPITKFFVISVLFGVLAVVPQSGGILLFFCSIFLFVSSLFLNNYLSGSLFGLYVGGVILFAMMGMPGGERVAGCFSFGLPLGILIFLFEGSFRERFNKPPAVPLIVAVNLLFVGLLYAGSFLLPAPGIAKLPPDTVIKISDDPTINKSLYYSQDGRIFYTEKTEENVGQTKKYTLIACEKGDFNGSFKQPCVIK